MSKKITNQDQNLFAEIKDMIEKARSAVNQTVNAGLTLMYWNIGNRIKQEILKQERAEYGKQIISSLSKDLVVQFGRSFELRNLRRMVQFSEQFHDQLNCVDGVDTIELVAFCRAFTNRSC